MPKFGDLESAIMEQIWRAERPLLVREVLEGLSRGLAYNTVHTVTEILHRKGWLTKERDGRAFRYGAAAGRDKYVAGLVTEALSLTDDRSAALVGFVEGIRPEEAEELHRLLSAARKKEARS
jgi:predicted transcriptional regulator